MSVSIARTANPNGVNSSGNVATYNNADIGTAHPDRIVVVLVTTELSAASINSCTLGGSAMNAGDQGNQGIVYARAFYLAYPTGTTATIAVTFGANPASTQNHISVYNISDAAYSAKGFDESTDMDSTDPLTTGSKTIAAGGGMIAVAGCAADTVAKTWSVAGEDLDADVGSHRHTTWYSTTDATQTLTCTGGTNGEDGALSYLIFTNLTPSSSQSPSLSPSSSVSPSISPSLSPSSSASPSLSPSSSISPSISPSSSQSPSISPSSSESQSLSPSSSISSSESPSQSPSLSPSSSESPSLSPSSSQSPSLSPSSSESPSESSSQSPSLSPSSSKSPSLSPSSSESPSLSPSSSKSPSISPSSSSSPSLSPSSSISPSRSPSLSPSSSISSSKSPSLSPSSSESASTSPSTVDSSSESPSNSPSASPSSSESESPSIGPNVFYKVNGLEIKSPSTFSIEKYNLTKAGRLTNGIMMLDLVGKKRKFVIQYNVLREQEYTEIINIIFGVSMFFTFEYNENSVDKSAICYVGAIKQQQFRTESTWYWKDVAFDFIEK